MIAVEDSEAHTTKLIKVIIHQWQDNMIVACISYNFILKIFIFFRLLIMSYALLKYSLLTFSLILIDFYKD